MSMKSFSKVFEELHFLGTLEVKWLKLWAKAFWQWLQIGTRLRPVGIHAATSCGRRYCRCRRTTRNRDIVNIIKNDRGKNVFIIYLGLERCESGRI